jgi:nucleoside phosphorylase
VVGPGADQVDVGIITILDGEFDAIYRRLPSKPRIVSGQREYNLCTLPTLNDDHCSIALTRCLAQGTGEAQSVARALLEDLDPQWLLVVGIAGTVPASELTLGDVVVSRDMLDFSVEAVAADRRREFAVTGAWIHPTAQRIVANLSARRDELGAWSSRDSIGADRPDVELRDDAIEGDHEWCARVRTSLQGHFSDTHARDPIFVSATVASSDRLVKDPEVIATWLRVARQIRAIEMEFAGAYRAAHAHHVPAITIRGISDVVGFKRDDAWAAYACQSAAAFTMAFLRLGTFPSRARLGRAAPPIPRYPSPEIQGRCEQLALARERRARMQGEGLATSDVDREILALRRELRDGGQLQAGDTLGDGRFLLVESIGRGGFASVWLAFDHTRSQHVALKVLHANLAGDALRRERFFRGARIMAELDHPSVVRVLAREGHDLGFFFFVMEYVAGGNLLDAVLEKRIVRSQILAAMYAIGDALACAHARGFVHRDVKPENILLATDRPARLADFDLVGAPDTTGGTRTGGMLGTYIYGAPEQFQRPQDADARADVHGLGMTLVFALHGRALSFNATLDRARFIDTLDCSGDMKTILKRSIAIEPADRFPDIASFCLALSELPEVCEQLVAELCTVESSHLLVPFIRFHERMGAPPAVTASRPRTGPRCHPCSR